MGVDLQHKWTEISKDGGKTKSEREAGLNQHYATSYRPPSTATILDSQKRR